MSAYVPQIKDVAQVTHCLPRKRERLIYQAGKMQSVDKGLVIAWHDAALATMSCQRDEPFGQIGCAEMCAQFDMEKVIALMKREEFIQYVSDEYCRALPGGRALDGSDVPTPSEPWEILDSNVGRAGRCLRATRRMARMKQQRAAQLFGVSVSMISGHESGSKSISPAKLEAGAGGFDADAIWFKGNWGRIPQWFLPWWLAQKGWLDQHMNQDSFADATHVSD